MKLMILRHGEAEFGNGVDELRKLTDFGIKQIQSISAGLSPIDLMVISPLVRARQSGEIVSMNNQIKHSYNSDTLVPDYEVSDVLAWLEDVDAQNILLVSHNPLVTLLTQCLTGDNNVRFGTGTLVCLTGDVIAPQCMDISWIK